MAAVEPIMVFVSLVQSQPFILAVVSADQHNCAQVSAVLKIVVPRPRGSGTLTLPADNTGVFSFCQHLLQVLQGLCTLEGIVQRLNVVQMGFVNCNLFL